MQSHFFSIPSMLVRSNSRGNGGMRAAWSKNFLLLCWREKNRHNNDTVPNLLGITVVFTLLVCEFCLCISQSYHLPDKGGGSALALQTFFAKPDCESLLREGVKKSGYFTVRLTVSVYAPSPLLTVSIL